MEPGNLLELADVLRDEKRELEAEVARLQAELFEERDRRHETLAMVTHLRGLLEETKDTLEITTRALRSKPITRRVVQDMLAKLEAKPLDRTRYTQPFRRR